MLTDILRVQWSITTYIDYIKEWTSCYHLHSILVFKVELKGFFLCLRFELIHHIPLKLVSFYLDFDLW